MAGFMLTMLMYSGLSQRILRHFPNLDTLTRIGAAHFLMDAKQPVSLVIGDSRAEQWTDRCLYPDGSDHGLTVNLGRSGATTLFWSDLVVRYATFFPKTDNITIWVGFNDLSHFSTPPDRIIIGLRNMVSELIPLTKRLVVVGQIPVAVSPPDWDKKLNEEIQHLEMILNSAFGRDDRVIYISLYPRFEFDLSGEDSFYRDGIHLSRVGDGYVCQLIRAGLAD